MTDVYALQPTIILYFFREAATPEFYTLSLHDALPISPAIAAVSIGLAAGAFAIAALDEPSWSFPLYAFAVGDRKSTRLNSSHEWISYAVFCLKKKINAYKAARYGPTSEFPFISVIRLT